MGMQLKERYALSTKEREHQAHLQEAFRDMDALQQYKQETGSVLSDLERSLVRLREKFG